VQLGQQAPQGLLQQVPPAGWGSQRLSRPIRRLSTAAQATVGKNRMRRPLPHASASHAALVETACIYQGPVFSNGLQKTAVGLGRQVGSLSPLIPFFYQWKVLSQSD